MDSRTIKSVLAILAFLVPCGAATKPCSADDWRGWMGNERDGVYRETGIIDEVPETGLKIKWRKKNFFRLPIGYELFEMAKQSRVMFPNF